MTVPPDRVPTYLASVALEPNRWKRDPERVPSLAVSEWSERALAAGFEGWELWERHYLMAPAGERRALQESVLPVRIFNTYLRPGLDPDGDWGRAVLAVTELGPQVQAMKFNLGEDLLPVGEQIVAARRWAQRLPAGVRMWCECHGRTVLETPEAARQALAAWPAGRFAIILHPLTREEGRLQAWLDAVGGRALHLHWQARDEHNRICALAEVPEGLARARASLAAAGFTGTQTIEFVAGTGRPGESPEKLFAAAVADLATLRGALLKS